jgi:hypothetical protein
MDRKILLEEVKDYFSISDHWRRLCSAMANDQEPHGSHIHTYVETSVHPDSLEKIIVGYFKRLGWPSARKIDHLSPKPGMGAIHGIEPEGKPHFDFQYFFKKNIGMKPLEGGESGCNLLVWNRWYMNQFYSQFDFNTVGDKEREKLKEYFKSDHFMKGLEFPILPTTCHFHINVHSSVHPDFIQKYAEEAFKREGIEVYYTCPNVYLVDGNYRGKLVFMCKDPEVVFDIGWEYRPNVVIEPAWEKWVMGDDPGYDVWTTAQLEKVLQADFITLTDDEINDVLDSCHYLK